MRHGGLDLEKIGRLTPYQLWEVYLSPDWEQDREGVPLFLQRPEVTEQAGRPSPRDIRREKARRRGVPEHLIDAELARLDAQHAEMVRRAEAGKRRRS